MLHMSARGLRLVEVFAPICAVAGRCHQRHSDSDAFWGGRRRAPRRKQGMLIPLMVALISKLFCSQRLADYVELRGWSTRHRHVPQSIITSSVLLKCWICLFSQGFSIISDGVLHGATRRRHAQHLIVTSQVLQKCWVCMNFHCFEDGERAIFKTVRKPYEFQLFLNMVRTIFRTLSK